jgi:hypothetical protein
MRRRASVGLIASIVVLMAIVCSGCSLGASRDPVTPAQATDRAATSEYLRARKAFIRSASADLPAGRIPMAALIGHVRAACAGALRGTPLSQPVPPVQSMSPGQKQVWLKYTRLTRRIEEVLEAAQQRRLDTAIKRFTATVASSRWNDPRITDLVNTFIQIERQRLYTPQPDVCREIKKWMVSDYRQLPAPLYVGEPGGAIGRRWTHDVAVLGCGKFSPATPRVVLTALRSYQRPGAQPTTRQVELMEISLTFEESYARTNANRSLAQALGLPVPRTKLSTRLPSAAALNAFHEPPGCSGQPDRLYQPVKKSA